MSRIDLEKEDRFNEQFDERRNSDPYAPRDPYHSDVRYDSRPGPYDAYPPPYPHGSPEPRPYRYRMALSGFILGLFGALVPASIWLQFGIDSRNETLGAMSLLLLPLAGLCAVIGLILSIISVRSSRGAKYAIAGICLSILSFLIFGTFFMVILFFSVSILRSIS